MVVVSVSIVENHRQQHPVTQPLMLEPTYKPGSMASISFHEINVDVPDSQGRKTILHNIYGRAEVGRLLVFMGASGAGKSTLLDVLSNTKISPGVRVRGTILVNGEPVNKGQFAKMSSYVKQSDVLLASATVREALTTSALLRLPYKLPLSRKLERVDAVLRELELESAADTLVGDELLNMKGISGGQKRRLSVACELIKDPTVLFLDEPTSGLDSEMALSCMEALVRLVKKNRTVICTIHQPNSDITSLFDDFLLLAEGHCVYFGPYTDAVDFFSQHGFTCPNYRNPTDFFMSVVRDHDNAESLWKAQEQQVQVAYPATPEEHSEAPSASFSVRAMLSLPSTKQVKPIDLEKGTTLDSLKDLDLTSTDHPPWWYQVGVLCQRRYKDWLRNPNLLYGELLQYFFMGLLFGLMYFKSFTHELPDGVDNRINAIWFSFTIMAFTPSYTAVTVWDAERVLLRRELNQKLYSSTVNSIARTIMLVPFEAAQILLFVILMYFLAGFQLQAGKLFIFFFTLLLFQLTSESWGLVSAVITPSATYGIIVVTFLLLFLLSFSGFLVSRIPVFFQWAKTVSFLTYAQGAVVYTEFQGIHMATQNGTVIEGVDAIPAKLQSHFSVWANIGILAAHTVGMELVKFLALHLADKLNLL